MRAEGGELRLLLWRSMEAKKRKVLKKKKKKRQHTRHSKATLSTMPTQPKLMQQRPPQMFDSCLSY